jgi:DNA-binding transcriptional MerR regulator
MKKSGITELAHLLGLSTEAIRKYEKKGILDVPRNDQSKFREYDIWDIATLLYARKYSRMGFSVSKIAELLNSIDTDAMMNTIRTRHQELSDEIEFRRRLIISLERWEKDMHEWENLGRECCIGHRPKILFCKLFDSNDGKIEKGLLEYASEWIQHLPFMSLSILSKRENVLKGVDDYTVGLCTLEDNLDWLGLHDLPNKTVLDTCSSVITYITGRFSNPITIRDFSPALRYMNDRGYVLSGDIFSKVVLTQKVDGEYCFHHKIWFPITSA